MKSFNLQSKILIILGIVAAAVFAFFSWSVLGGGTTLGVTLGGANSGTSLSNGLVGHWTFDGANPGIDRSGNGNDSEFISIATSSAVTAGIIGQGVGFNGGSAYADVNNSPELQFSSESFSVASWVYVNSTISSNAAAIGNAEFQAGGYMLGVLNNGNVSFIANDSTTEYKVNKAINFGEWFHMVYVFDASTNTYTAYFNGSSVGTVSSADVTDSGSNVLIGRGQQGGWTSSLDGKVDDARIYNRALSADEIKRLYQLGATTKLNKTLDGNTKDGGPVAHWTFDGKDVVDNVADVSGNANHGAMKNFTATNTALTRGKLGQGMTFDGVDDYVSAGQIFGSTPNAVTVSVWVKRPVQSGFGSIVDFATPPEAIYIESYHELSRILVGAYVGTGGNAFSGQTNEVQIPDVGGDEWTHITQVITSSQMSVYENSELVSSLNGSYDLSKAQNSLYFGGFARSYLEGQIDDVRIYDRALLADEIQRLYQLGATTKLNKTLSSGGTESGLVGHWTFDGKDVVDNVADVSGNANHGLMQNFTATNTALTRGRLGQGIEFDGVDDYVEISGVKDLSTTNAFTASVWAKSNQSNWNDTGFLLSRRDQFVMHPNSGTKEVNFYVNTTQNGWEAVGHLLSDITSWHLYTISYQDGSFKAYVDGEEVASGTKGSTLSSDTGVITIGRDDGLGRYGDVIEDDVRIYDRALSAEEVKRLYDLGR